jgi:chromosome segregation ATPase
MTLCVFRDSDSKEGDQQDWALFEKYALTPSDKEIIKKARTSHQAARNAVTEATAKVDDLSKQLTTQQTLRTTLEQLQQKMLQMISKIQEEIEQDKRNIKQSESAPKVDKLLEEFETQKDKNLKEINGEIERLDNHLLQLQTNANSSDTEIAQVRESLRTKRQDELNIRTTCYQKETEIVNKYKEKNNELTKFRKNVISLQEKLSTLELDLSVKTAELEKTKSDLSGIVQQIDEAKANLAKAEEAAYQMIRSIALQF